MIDLRVMSYNVHACLGTDGRMDPDRVARVIAQSRPDVVALQEVDHGRRRTGYRHQAREIADVLEMVYHFHPSLEVDDGHYGNAILSRYPLEVLRAAPLARPWPVLRLEPRAAIWVRVLVDGLPFHLVNTHLGLLPGERLRQVHDLLSGSWLGHPDCLGPIVLCGDLNSTPGSPAWRNLCRCLRDIQMDLPAAARHNTYASYLPVARLDHVLVSPHVAVRGVEVPRNALTRVASDHLPLVVDLTLHPEPQEVGEAPRTARA